MPNFEKIVPGARPQYPADFYNAQVDMINGATVRGLPKPDPIVDVEFKSHVLIKNNDQGGVLKGNILGIDGVVFTPQQNEKGFVETPILDCSLPKIHKHRSKFVVTTEAIPPGKLGYGVIFGSVRCKVEVKHEDVWFADIKHDDPSQLQSAATGAQILFKESGTGTKWAYLLIGKRTMGAGVFVTPAGGIGEDDSAFCQLHVLGPGTGVNWIPTGVVEQIFNTAGAVASYTRIQAKTDSNMTWLVDVEKC